jgi:hypothetical protein
MMTHIINAEVIQSLCDLDLLSSVEKGICKLLALSKGTLNDLEVGYIAQEVADAGIRIVPPVDVWVLPGWNGSKSFMAFN